MDGKGEVSKPGVERGWTERGGGVIVAVQVRDREHVTKTRGMPR